MYVYCYYGIITFVIKLVIKKKVKLVIIYTFDWLSKYIVYYVYMYGWVWLFELIINTMHVGLSFFIQVKIFL